MTIQAFSHLERCVDRTENFFHDWNTYGGKVEKSVLNMRNHIAEDNNSELSILVKSSWKIQEEKSFFEAKENFGYWPVDDENLSIVLESFLSSDKNLLGECGALAM